MYIPSENMANAFFIAVTGGPATLYAIALSHSETTLVVLAVNVCLAILMKAVDICVRIYMEKKNNRDK